MESCGKFQSRELGKRLLDSFYKKEFTSERYRLRHLPIEIDRHPTFTTDYIARVEIVDTRGNKTVETVEAYGKESSPGRKGSAKNSG
jgi:hypothetical protein